MCFICIDHFFQAKTRVTGIKDGMECLFDADKPHFATWLWIYNVDYWDGRPFSATHPKPEAHPLYYAARLGFCGLAEHLIAEHPEHVNARGGVEETSMHVAATTGFADILSLLSEHGAEMDVRNRHGRTPLHQASSKGRLEAARCLLDRGADINARNKFDQTPLFLAVYYGHVEFARMLLDRGARTNVPDKNSGTTPLHLAVGNRDIQTVRLLLEHGADVDARDKRGRSPSRLTKREDIVALLFDYGGEAVK
jgi:ankyrin repeat protein